MGQFIARFWLRLIAGVGFVYFTFFVHIGSRTLWEHAKRIADTSEARELGNEIVAALDTAKTAVTRRLGNHSAGSD